MLAFRFRRHQLDGGSAGDVNLLDYGVQDTGPDGAPWALSIRGWSGESDLAYAWTLRGAPHAYRRDDLAGVAIATAPFSEEDGAKRIFDASKQLKAAGISPLEALRTVATEMRKIATKPVVKGEVSSALTKRLDEPYLRFCRPCNAIHAYEQTFRLAALQAGLELEAGTSPPVVRKIPRLKPNLLKHLGDDADEPFDVVRNYLRFYGPARHADAAAFLDAASKDVKACWPDDTVEVEVDGEKRWILDQDLAELRTGSSSTGTVRLAGPYDPYLQVRDRDLLVPSEAKRKTVWPVLGRPGAVLIDGDIAATWRPRTSSKKLKLEVNTWRRLTKAEGDALDTEAERLAAFRGVEFAGLS